MSGKINKRKNVEVAKIAPKKTVKTQKVEKVKAPIKKSKLGGVPSVTLGKKERKPKKVIVEEVEEEEAEEEGEIEEKPKRVRTPVIVKVGTKRQVFNGRALKTSGGLTGEDLIRSKSGRIVSKRASEQAQIQWNKRAAEKSVSPKAETGDEADIESEGESSKEEKLTTEEISPVKNE